MTNKPTAYYTWPQWYQRKHDALETRWRAETEQNIRIFYADKATADAQIEKARQSDNVHGLWLHFNKLTRWIK